MTRLDAGFFFRMAKNITSLAIGHLSEKTLCLFYSGYESGEALFFCCAERCVFCPEATDKDKERR